MTTAIDQRVVLRAEHISKRFGLTQALDDVSVEFRVGEIHALMGENGAGKSTLGKVIAGLHKQDSGTITLHAGEGTEVSAHAGSLRPGSIEDAAAAGIRLVHQELAQCGNLSVAENLCLADMPRTRLGTVDFGAMVRRAERLLDELEPGIDVRAPLESLPPGHRQIVQIAASLSQDGPGEHSSAKTSAPPRVIVFDEPTSSLSISEVERLLDIVRQIAASGITCVYVSHRMSEIFAVCDRVSVLRDGKYVATSNVKDIDESTLVEQMIGRKVPPPVRRARPNADSAQLASLSVKNLCSSGSPARSSSTPLHDVSLNVMPGEILGVGGLVGAGRSELFDAVFGLDPLATGTIEIAGSPTPLLRTGSAHAGPRAAIAAGVGYVPEDRKLQGLFFQLGIGENIAVPVMPAFAQIGVRNVRSERAHVDSRLRDFQVKAAGTRALPGSLSGGNQQKLLIARWMGERTKVLLLDEPTRGIDVGTKAEIYRLVREAAQRGTAILVVSSEMPELLALSDRIIVLSDGRVTGELNGDDMTQSNILKLATQGH